MDISAPFQGLFPTVDSSVLTVLTGSKKPRTGREVAKLAGRSPRATKLVLDRLVEHGLVFREEVGRSQAYTLNWDHLAATPVFELANLRLTLFHRLQAAVERWSVPPCHLSVFGSAARADGDVDSDIDIFLVRPSGVDEEDKEWRGQVSPLAGEIFRWTGNHAGISEVDEDDLDRLRSDRPAILESLRRDAVDIFGIPIRSFIRRA